MRTPTGGTSRGHTRPGAPPSPKRSGLATLWRACCEKPQLAPSIQGDQHPVISLTVHPLCPGDWGSPTVKVKRRMNYRTKRCAKDQPPPRLVAVKLAGKLDPDGPSPEKGAELWKAQSSFLLPPWSRPRPISLPTSPVVHSISSL